MEKIIEDLERKRLLYRAMHRGFKEADIVIGSFAQDHLSALTEDQVRQFRELLEVPDQDLYAWIIGRLPVPDNYDNDVMGMLKTYNVSDAINQRI